MVPFALVGFRQRAFRRHHVVVDGIFVGIEEGFARCVHLYHLVIAFPVHQIRDNQVIVFGICLTDGFPFPVGFVRFADPSHPGEHHRTVRIQRFLLLLRQIADARFPVGCLRHHLFQLFQCLQRILVVLVPLLHDEQRIVIVPQVVIFIGIVRLLHQGDGFLYHFVAP